MKEYRSTSQILFGFLPEQTVDLRGKVWKVKEWVDPRAKSVDPATLRQELERQLAPWAAAGKDGSYLEQLRRGFAVRFYSLNREGGVRVEKFPQNWVCKVCNRFYQSLEPSVCQCGCSRFGQLPFVGFHDECGAISAPYIKPCAAHKQIRIRFPGTARAEEIRFSCPICDKILQKGFGFRACTCGKGRTTFNVHRAASVFSPRTLAMINPPSSEKVQRIRDAGGASKALSWVLGGLKERTFDELEVTRESFASSLLKQGIPKSLVEQMVEQAIQAGAIGRSSPKVNLGAAKLQEAEKAAVDIALALVDSRTRIVDMLDRSVPGSDLAGKYQFGYARGLAKIGLESIEFLDSFPVATGCYGYTRGPMDAGASRLVPFRNRQGDYVVYGDVAKTEALFVRLDPHLIGKWLARAGCQLDAWVDPASARQSILRATDIPKPGESVEPTRPGVRLLTVVHSFAHWFVRQLAVHSGVERNALSEFLIPQHCSFFIYAASRGDFVLGGLQAVFETGLDSLLNELAASDMRCALDPGCLRVGGACVACLHLGETSCRYYNRFLGRATLTGPDGYLPLVRAAG